MDTYDVPVAYVTGMTKEVGMELSKGRKKEDGNKNVDEAADILKKN